MTQPHENLSQDSQKKLAGNAQVIIAAAAQSGSAEEVATAFKHVLGDVPEEQ